jgi:hypothetical protein
MRTPKKPFKLRITKTDARKAGYYTDNTGCLLCQALIRRGFQRVSATDDEAGTSVGRFGLSLEDANRILAAYSDGAFSPLPAHAFKPFTITLTPV